MNMTPDAACIPVFIVGVPRSGTTLLRTLLDSHPNIACGPESPWIAGSYGDLTSFKDLYASLTTDERGPVKNLTGVDAADVARALGRAVSGVFEAYARARGKGRWVEKTPSHILDLDFLHAMFPEARYLHIVRDGRDVACSTFNGREQWKMLVDQGGAIEITRNNALERWARWELRLARARAELGLRVLRLRYEDLVVRPEQELAEVLDFIGERFDPCMLDYASRAHDFPGWEAGSTDVRRRTTFTDTSVGRWRTEYPPRELALASDLVREKLAAYGYQHSPRGDYD